MERGIHSARFVTPRVRLRINVAPSPEVVPFFLCYLVVKIRVPKRCWSTRRSFDVRRSMFVVRCSVPGLQNHCAISPRKL